MEKTENTGAKVLKCSSCGRELFEFSMVFCKKCKKPYCGMCVHRMGETIVDKNKIVSCVLCKEGN